MHIALRRTEATNISGGDFLKRAMLTRDQLLVNDNSGDGYCEPKHACGRRKHALPEAILVMRDVVGRFRNCDGCLDSQSGWFNVDEICLLTPVPFILNISQASIDAKLIAQEEEIQKTINCARIAAGTFLEIGKRMISQIKKFEAQFNTLRLRKGMLSLPDEILAIVLKFAAYEHESHASESSSNATSIAVRRSAKLSHVCQRFRRVLVTIPTLWNRILSAMPKDMVTTCCCRFAIANVEVTLEHPTRHLAHLTASGSELIDSFIPTAASSSSYWRSYVHGHRSSYVNSGFTVDELKELAVLTHGLDAPFLYELVLNYPQDTLGHSEERFQEYRDAVHYFTTWTILMPKLASLVTVNLIPRPFQLQNSPSLKKLNMSMSGSELHLQGLSSFLSSHPFLEEFILGLQHADSSQQANMRTLLALEVRLPSIRKLDFHIYYCSGDHIKSMFDIHRFPNASSMKPRVYGASYWYGLVERMDDVIHAVLPGVHVFPKLALLDLGFGFDSWGRTNPTGRLICTISIPFAGLVNLNHLILSTTDYDIISIPDGSCLPALRSLVLKDCRKLERECISAPYASYCAGEFLAFTTDGRRL